MPVWLYIVALVIGTGLALWRGYFPAVKHFRERLTSNKPYRDVRAEDLRHPRIASLYEDWLDGALRMLRTLMGPSWSPRAFGICLTLGLLYSSAFLVVSWGFFGASGLVGQTQLLPNWPLARRSLLSAGLLFYCWILYYVAWRLGRRASERGATVAVAVSGTTAGAGILSVVVAAALAGGGAAGGAGAVAGAAAVAVAVAGIGGQVGAVAGTTAVAVAVALALAGVGAGAVVVFRSLGIGPPYVRTDLLDQAFVLLWITLPVINAFWDWISWWISRGLGEHLLETIRKTDLNVARKAWSGLWHAALDLSLAIAFLVLLARTLPWAVGQFNAWVEWLGGTAPFELAGYLCASAKAPWSTGLWGSLMLLSTLFPTALHAMAALASPLAAGALWLQRDEKLARRLTTEAPGSPGFDAAVDDAAAHFAWTWMAVWIFAGLLVTGAFFSLLRLGNLVTSELPEPLPGSLREALLGVALWDFAAAKACLAASPRGV